MFFASSDIGIVGSNPTRGIDVGVYSVFVLSCVGRGLVKGLIPVQGIVSTVYKIYNFTINSEWAHVRETNLSRWRKKKKKNKIIKLYLSFLEES
jgi:hypothetical protein